MTQPDSFWETEMMKRPRILLADDHPGVAEALKSLLSSEYELVATVGDGLAMVSAATRLEPDVIVADISMPGLDGLNALAELRKINPHVKVVFTTMYGEASFVSLALEAGAFGFVLKHSAA